MSAGNGRNKLPMGQPGWACPADHALAEVLPLAAGGEDDEGDGRQYGIGTEGGELAVAVHAGHGGIAEDEMRAVAAGEGQGDGEGGA